MADPLPGCRRAPADRAGVGRLCWPFTLSVASCRQSRCESARIWARADHTASTAASDAPPGLADNALADAPGDGDLQGSVEATHETLQSAGACPALPRRVRAWRRPFPPALPPPDRHGLPPATRPRLRHRARGHRRGRRRPLRGLTRAQHASGRAPHHAAGARRYCPSVALAPPRPEGHRGRHAREQRDPGGNRKRRGS